MSRNTTRVGNFENDEGRHTKEARVGIYTGAVYDVTNCRKLARASASATNLGAPLASGPVGTGGRAARDVDATIIDTL